MAGISQWTVFCAISLALGVILQSKMAAASCESCENGGRLLLPNNIFGVCRCVCKPQFQGPKCQFSIRKRSYSDFLQKFYDQYVENPSDKNSQWTDSGLRYSLMRYFLEKMLEKDAPSHSDDQFY